MSEYATIRNPHDGAVLTIFPGIMPIVVWACDSISSFVLFYGVRYRVELSEHDLVDVLRSRADVEAAWQSDARKALAPEGEDGLE